MIDGRDGRLRRNSGTSAQKISRLRIVPDSPTKTQQKTAEHPFHGYIKTLRAADTCQLVLEAYGL